MAPCPAVTVAIMKVPLLILAEHLNATYAINFGLPLKDGPWRLLARSGDELQSLGSEALIRQWEAQLGGQPPRALIISREVAPQALALVRHFQRRAVPVLFHLDDWMFGLPEALGPRYTARYNQGYRHQLDNMLCSCDGVLASTAPLAELLRQRHPGVQVWQSQGVIWQAFQGPWSQPKAWLSRARRRWRQRGQVLVGYAGSSSHERDLATLLPALMALMSRCPQVRFETFGLAIPTELAQRWPTRVGSYGYTRDYASYQKTLFELGWDIGLCPLVDDDFNRAKTATKLLEYSACSIPALCADLPPYRDLLGEDNALLAPSDWMDQLPQWVETPQRRQAALARSRHRLQVLTGIRAARKLDDILNALRPSSLAP